MKALLSKRNRGNLMRILAPFVVFLTVIWARTQVIENIHPFELLWVLWVLSTWVSGVAFGAMAMDVWHTRNR